MASLSVTSRAVGSHQKSLEAPNLQRARDLIAFWRSNPPEYANPEFIAGMQELHRLLPGYALQETDSSALAAAEQRANDPMGFFDPRTALVAIDDTVNDLRARQRLGLMVPDSLFKRLEQGKASINERIEAAAVEHGLAWSAKATAAQGPRGK